MALAGWDQEQWHGARGVAQGGRAPAATPHRPPPAFPPPAHGSWGVSYPPELRSITGSCVVFPCTLSFPDSVSASKGIVAIWYKDYSNQKTVVYHSEGQDVDARFRDRAQLLGDPAAHNCTLLLRGVTPEDSGPYKFRFEIVDGDRWSAERDVELRVSGGYGGDPPLDPVLTHPVRTSHPQLPIPRCPGAPQHRGQRGGAGGDRGHLPVLHALRLPAERRGPALGGLR